jgi:20S proteasome subunit beta 7
MTPSETHTYLTRVFYQRRNKMDPFWNTLAVAGFHEGKSFLGYLDMIGTAFTDDFVATGYGKHLAIPLLRKRWSADMDESEARTLLEDWCVQTHAALSCAALLTGTLFCSMKVLFYRDCRTINRIQIAKVTAEGSIVSEPYSLETKWDYQSFIDPKAGAETGGSW